uniref:Reticulocalbin-3 n=1 Tax=Strigamia maritima TaxID=126957 RepID=T1JLL4_STRMM
MERKFFSLLMLVGLLLFMAVGLAIPKPDDQSNRIVDKPLSTEKHYGMEEEHNADYDHEAFLGEQEAKTFDQLSPEESKERLAKIADKIDKNEDGEITLDELKEWIKYTQMRYIREDVDHIDESNLNQDDGSYSYKDMLRRDNRRWSLADKDTDGALTKDEFLDFLHPEEADHMRDVVIIVSLVNTMETMEDIDKDKDEKISLDEYIGDMYRGNPGEEEPDWVKNEREQFGQYRDKNGDGWMDKDEVKLWIVPPDYDHAEAEAKHLIFESDSNQDKKLTKQEILDKYDLFVGSQATDFGEALGRHDEF